MYRLVECDEGGEIWSGGEKIVEIDPSDCRVLAWNLEGGGPLSCEADLLRWHLH